MRKVPSKFALQTDSILHVPLRDEDEDDEDEDDEEDDTAELLRELEKVKRERAEEKERQEREQSEKSQAEREAEIATANPLLNLAAALGQTPNGVNTTKPGTFAVKRRWDDGALSTFSVLWLGRALMWRVLSLSDLIFKNQAMSTRDKDKEPQFVNDLLRTEFHKCVPTSAVFLSPSRTHECCRKFMSKFIKVCYPCLPFRTELTVSG